MCNKNNRKGGLVKPRLATKVALAKALPTNVGSQRDIESRTQKRNTKSKRKWVYKEALRIRSTNATITKKKIRDHHVRNIVFSLTKTMTNVLIALGDLDVQQ